MNDSRLLRNVHNMHERRNARVVSCQMTVDTSTRVGRVRMDTHSEV